MLFRTGLLLETFNTLFCSTCSCTVIGTFNSVSSVPSEKKKKNRAVHPGGSFPEKKQYLLSSITCFPFLPKRPRFSVPFVWITSARLHLERKQKLVFCKWHNSIPFLFSVPKKIPVPFDGSFHRNFPTNSKRSGKMVSVLKCAKILILF